MTSSIERGVRKAAHALKRAEQRRIKEGTLGFWEADDKEKVTQAREHVKKRQQEMGEQKSRLEWLSEDSTSGQLQVDEHLRRLKAKNAARSRGMLVDAPTAIPYTEATSEFLYGTFAVLAALQAKRRALHKLYLWCGEDGKLNEDDKDITRVVRLAKLAQVPLLRVAGNWDKMLDRMSDRRPHNGVVLEAGPIPKVLAKGLTKLKSINSHVEVELSSTNKTEATGSHKLPIQVRRKRYPFLLWLDKVTDTGNMGAILRSAYYFGVDAIIVPRHGTAPLSAVTVKSSAGAAEHVEILTIDNEIQFMQQSQQNGWKFFATGIQPQHSPTSIPAESPDSSADLSIEFALASHPCVLLLGNEGTGLRPFLQKQADQTVSIQGARDKGLIDSLNVSVAAAILTNRFLVNHISSGSTA
ncbi:hypothetical protein LTS08_001670 [Lithohypha guttulata]|nr:hypothetical protein LTS08_001670 [Lithohypha guttulata]